MSSPVTVGIVTDTAASLSPALLAALNIQVVPYWVHMGEDAFVSGVDITPTDFFRRLRANPDISIHTSVPAASKFQEIYADLAHRVQHIVSIHVAGKLSATCNTAEMAAKQSGIPITVVDTGTTAMSQGFVVLAAAKAAQAGASVQTVIETARKAVPNVSVVAMMESVKYALQGGRLSVAAAKVGSMLNIHPLIRVKDNKLSLCGQSRRRSKGIKALMNKVIDDVQDAPTRLAVHYAEDESEGQNLLDTLKQQVNCVESMLTRIPIELGVHAGPGTIGIAYHVERENEDDGILKQLGRITEQAKQAIQSRLPGSSDITA